MSSVRVCVSVCGYVSAVFVFGMDALGRLLGLEWFLLGVLEVCGGFVFTGDSHLLILCSDSCVGAGMNDPLLTCNVRRWHSMPVTCARSVMLGTVFGSWSSLSFRGGGCNRVMHLCGRL